MVASQSGNRRRVCALRVDKVRLNTDNCRVAKKSTAPKTSTASSSSNVSVAEDKVRRLQQQNQALQRRLDKANKKSTISFKFNRFGPLMFAMTFGVIGMYFALSGFASPGPSQGMAVSLSIEPATGQVVRGETFSVSVWADSIDDQMGVIQARLTYPAETFEFVSLDTSDSPFAVNRAPLDASVATAGSVIVSRAVSPTGVEGVTGRQLVGVVSFKAKSDAAANTTKAGATTMSFSDDSKVLRAGSSINILQRTSGGKYQI